MAVERIVPGTVEWDAYYANHITRYKFAVDRLKDKAVANLLDAACGVGYGSEYLSKNLSTSKVTAIDRSGEALSVANDHFKNDKVTFLEDDCHTLQAASAFAPFDAIVSFETLEHLPSPEKFLKSCYTNLKPGGTFIVSTPNQIISGPEGRDWQYHEKEYTPDELLELLKESGFTEVELYGQRLTALGKFREQMRAEFNTLYSNPFIRFGRSIQKMFRGHKFSAVLPEQPEDIEIKKYSDIADFYNEGLNGPFVLIAVTKR